MFQKTINQSSLTCHGFRLFDFRDEELQYLDAKVRSIATVTLHSSYRKISRLKNSYQSITQKQTTAALLRNKLLLLSLSVCSCPKLCSMPQIFGHSEVEKSLRIGWCRQLDTLPHGLANLSSLFCQQHVSKD